MEVKELNGKIRVYVKPGYQHMYREYDTRVEALINEVKICAGYVTVKTTGVDGLVPKPMAAELNIQRSTLSRVKNGLAAIPPAWLLKFHVWSGMPISDLEKLAGVESPVQPYRRRPNV